MIQMPQKVTVNRANVVLNVSLKIVSYEVNVFVIINNNIALSDSGISYLLYVRYSIYMINGDSS